MGELKKLASRFCLAIAALAWSFALAPVLAYSLFTQHLRLERGPCRLDQANVVFKTVIFCGSPGQAHLWYQINDWIVPALTGAGVLTTIATLTTKWAVGPKVTVNVQVHSRHGEEKPPEA